MIWSWCVSYNMMIVILLQGSV